MRTHAVQDYFGRLKLLWDDLNDFEHVQAVSYDKEQQTDWLYKDPPQGDIHGTFLSSTTQNLERRRVLRQQLQGLDVGTKPGICSFTNRCPSSSFSFS